VDLALSSEAAASTRGVSLVAIRIRRFACGQQPAGQRPPDHTREIAMQLCNGIVLCDDGGLFLARPPRRTTAHGQPGTFVVRLGSEERAGQ
jgi:hypothetical protein